MALDALILDLDGTVWESRTFYMALVASRRPGTLAGSNAARALQQAGWSRAAFAKACRSGKYSLACYPGIVDVLRTLVERRVPLGASTNLPKWIADPMLKVVGLADIVGTVVCWGDTRRHKPHPEPLLAAASRLGADPRSAWYVGDDPSDAVAAAAAGMRFAWASWGYTTAAPDGTGVILRRSADLHRLVEEVA